MTRRARLLILGAGSAAAVLGSLLALLAPHEADAPLWATVPLGPAILGLGAACVLAAVAYLVVRPLAERRPGYEEGRRE
jgi:MFS family permease